MAAAASLANDTATPPTQPRCDRQDSAYEKQYFPSVEVWDRIEGRVPGLPIAIGTNTGCRAAMGRLTGYPVLYYLGLLGLVTSLSLALAQVAPSSDFNATSVQ